MKRKVLHTILTVLGLMALAGCQESSDPMDAVKPFQPDNPYFKASMISLHFVLETQPIAKVDSLFRSMIDQYALPVNAEGCRDGVWEGISPYDAFDYRHVVKLTIQNEKIIHVDYDEVHVNGGSKESDQAYNQLMSQGGGQPSTAYPRYEKGLVAFQDMQKIESVSGASYSLYRFRYAVTVALMKARLG